MRRRRGKPDEARAFVARVAPVGDGRSDGRPSVELSVSEELEQLRREVREVCARFPAEYWRGLEPDRYPTEFVDALTAGGWLGALIPEEYGGAGLDLTSASVILEEINHS